ncbi:N-acetyltransferase [Marinobacter hydrocarbonoclasticus]|nr:N-acetyltransferase [Marinobacter nauticus]
MNIGLHHPVHPERIKALFSAVFAASEGPNEGELIGNLAFELASEPDNDDRLVFTAEQDGELVACIIFTRLRFAGFDSAFLLSPVAVSTAIQGQGVGQALIRFGLEQLKAAGVELAVTYGDPAFYGKVGFAVVTEAQVPSPQPLSFPHGWLAQSLSGQDLPALSAPVSCAAPLNKPDYW